MITCRPSASWDAASTGPKCSRAGPDTSAPVRALSLSSRPAADAAGPPGPRRRGMPGSGKLSVEDPLFREPPPSDVSAVVQADRLPGLRRDAESLMPRPTFCGSSSALALSSWGTSMERSSLAFLRTHCWARRSEHPLAAASKCSRRDTFWTRSKWCPCAVSTRRMCEPCWTSFSARTSPPYILCQRFPVGSDRQSHRCLMISRRKSASCEASNTGARSS
mmetsp:Transcript_71067/g.224456  ORF Transcript_71067/g.224456 Transcript_71067/m.224456 type:complete len:220 (-) Transcript_71067:245-904(-)